MYNRIRNLREDRDLTQSDMAKYLGCSQVSYSYYELGRRILPVDILAKLAVFFDTSTDYLLGLTDNKTPYERSK